jgi:4-hydroxybenzoate polyprenyltransferase
MVTALIVFCLGIDAVQKMQQHQQDLSNAQTFPMARHYQSRLFWARVWCGALVLIVILGWIFIP